MSFFLRQEPINVQRERILYRENIFSCPPLSLLEATCQKTDDADRDRQGTARDKWKRKKRERTRETEREREREKVSE